MERTHQGAPSRGPLVLRDYVMERIFAGPAGIGGPSVESIVQSGASRSKEQ